MELCLVGEVVDGVGRFEVVGCDGREEDTTIDEDDVRGVEELEDENSDVQEKESSEFVEVSWVGVKDEAVDPGVTGLEEEVDLGDGSMPMEALIAR